MTVHGGLNDDDDDDVPGSETKLFHSLGLGGSVISRIMTVQGALIPVGSIFPGRSALLL
jgi:hypothetical protein